jgi:hypothetical protein
MDFTVTIISSIACALIYTFIIKPKRDKKAAAEAAQKEEKEEEKKEKEEKEGGRYFFYNGRCSFKLDGPIIKNEEEKDDKYIVATEKVEAVIWILPEMPIHDRYPWIVGTEEMKVGDYPCVAAYSKTYSGIQPSYFIDCGDFVVQVNLPNRNTKEEQDFLNSFRLEK